MTIRWASHGPARRLNRRGGHKRAAREPLALFRGLSFLLALLPPGATSKSSSPGRLCRLRSGSAGQRWREEPLCFQPEGAGARQPRRDEMGRGAPAKGKVAQLPLPGRSEWPDRQTGGGGRQQDTHPSSLLHSPPSWPLLWEVRGGVQGLLLRPPLLQEIPTGFWTDKSQCFCRRWPWPIGGKGK